MQVLPDQRKGFLFGLGQIHRPLLLQQSLRYHRARPYGVKSCYVCVRVRDRRSCTFGIPLWTFGNLKMASFGGLSVQILTPLDEMSVFSSRSDPLFMP